jgi:hypothetical protein
MFYAGGIVTERHSIVYGRGELHTSTCVTDVRFRGVSWHKLYAAASYVPSAASSDAVSHFRSILRTRRREPDYAVDPGRNAPATENVGRRER